MRNVIRIAVGDAGVDADFFPHFGCDRRGVALQCIFCVTYRCGCGSRMNKAKFAKF